MPPAQTSGPGGPPAPGPSRPPPRAPPRAPPRPPPGPRPAPPRPTALPRGSSARPPGSAAAILPCGSRLPRCAVSAAARGGRAQPGGRRGAGDGRRRREPRRRRGRGRGTGGQTHRRPPLQPPPARSRERRLTSRQPIKSSLEGAGRGGRPEARDPSFRPCAELSSRRPRSTGWRESQKASADPGQDGRRRGVVVGELRGAMATSRLSRRRRSQLPFRHLCELGGQGRGGPVLRAAPRRGASLPTGRLPSRGPGRRRPSAPRRELSVPSVEAGCGGRPLVAACSAPDESTETGLPSGSRPPGARWSPAAPGRAGAAGARATAAGRTQGQECGGAPARGSRGAGARRREGSPTSSCMRSRGSVVPGVAPSEPRSARGAGLAAGSSASGGPV